MVMILVHGDIPAGELRMGNTRSGNSSLNPIWQGRHVDLMEDTSWICAKKHPKKNLVSPGRCLMTNVG